ncbi:GNAT family N-acetyltransferase [Exilibacterium tricleocarpae]|uniref:GNAT family N-acetyltransferase n=1 Tax=Exilibacterium tricleocarpae TaxID=2591008 RepID=A0A545UA04_9GAMM|nr:GNAT family N-acetyltransferase [Exilibacterium tricleocarpae]TQV86304.1 GNAT family N-acetyltransferase [Exilibacterium tricleocarpae]
MLHRADRQDSSFSYIQEDWNAQYKQSHFQGLGNTYEWCIEWWKRYGESDPNKALYILSDDEKTTLFPLMQNRKGRVKTIEFMAQSDGAFTDYVGPLCETTSIKKHMVKLLDFLYNHTRTWDFTSLRLALNEQAYSDLIAAIVDASRSHPINWDVTTPMQYVTVTLPNHFDDYLASLGSRTRQDIKKYLRNSAKAGMEFKLLSGQDAVDNLHNLFKLNAKNWNTFSNIKDREFLTSVAIHLIENNKRFLLPQLILDGETIATVFGYQIADCCYLHTAGINRQYSGQVSPGLTLYAYLIKEMIESGISTIDFSPGAEEYKLRLGGKVAPIYQFNFQHPDSPVIRKKINHLNASLRRKLNKLRKRA